MRRLSVKECAIIQTFPDDFICKNIHIMYKQIGNAVTRITSKNDSRMCKANIG